ncbi:MFS transporter [Streptomyces sp. NPDC003077]|uniref:MFS transporter n=1 Tax=Streptomyces sp. NPDC003077 TaxID=3154443 RepID=UPI0033AB3D89
MTNLHRTPRRTSGLAVVPGSTQATDRAASVSPVPAPGRTPAPVTAPGPVAHRENARPGTPHARRWLILGIASAAQFLAVLDLIGVTIAFPAIGRDFASASTAQLSWVLNAYTVVLAAFLIPAGRIADETGRRRSFLLGMVLFGLASAACGAAPTTAALIAARVVQGLAAAVLIPTSLSLALPAFPPRERATAVGVWTAVSAVAASSGPVIGGVLAAVDWRWIFLVNVPVVVVAVAAGVRFLPRSAPGLRQRPDLVGTALILLCVGALVTGCVQVPEWGLTAPGTLAALAVGGLAGALCAVHVRRAADPVVRPDLFRTRGFTVATLGLLAYFVAYSAATLGATLLFTDLWHYSTPSAGLALAPWPLTVLVVSAFSGRIVRAAGERPTALIGALCFVAAPVWWLCLAGNGGNYAVEFLPGLVLAGFGTGLYQPVMFAVAGRLPAERLSLGSGVLMVSRQGGTALGVAVLTAVLGQRITAEALDTGWVLMAVAAALAVLAAALLRGPEGTGAR